MKIGIISDTHGLIRPAVLHLFDGCDMIIHAGDVGSPHVIEDLMNIARVHAVRGNTDSGAWAAKLPETEMIEAGEKHLYVIHDISSLDIDAHAAGIAAVIYGHSHLPAVSEQDGILYVNPGSAGPKRAGKPVSAGIMQISNGRIIAKTITLQG
jgi:putative phosphoesterase